MGCCSGTDFTPATDAALSESQRVNYTFGMVLGVDDFRQEQAWLAGRDLRALRETIGYGVLAGLAVSRELTSSECTVRVQPGLALAPDGRLVAVPTEQCASLKSWVEGSGGRSPPSSGDATAYVLLSWDETLGTPVPIPGEPCRDESAQQADSRWSDAFRLGFAWAPDAPVRAEDRALRLFSAWLRALPVRDTPPEGAVTLQQFGEAVRTVIGQALREHREPPDPLPDDGHDHALVLPRAQYREYLGAAFDVWTRALRAEHLAPYGPVQLATAAGSPASERSLVLAELRFTLGAHGELQLAGGVTVEALGQPMLLHLRLIQEWLLTQPEDDAPWDAWYVIGREDERLPNAQNLLERFFPQRRGPRNNHGPMARVDRVANPGLPHAVLTPAEKYAGEPGADYYGPQMDAPIPVGDGGTGQAAAPADFQLLVGADGHFALGDLVAGGGSAPSLSVTHGAGERTTDLVVDTVQPLHAQASPGFAGLTLTGTAQTPPVPALQVHAGAQVDTLDITTLGPALLAANAQHRVVSAPRWSGTLPTGTDAVPPYYGPGQEQPVRIVDGGTGLAALPAPLQVLVGRNDGTPAAYVLAQLQAGPNASIALTHSDTQSLSHGPQRTYTLTVDALSSGMSVQARDGGNVTVDLADNMATLDTVELPTFTNVRLTKPEGDDATHRVGWNGKTRLLVASNQAARSHLRVVSAAREAKVGATDEVLVFVGDGEFKVELPDPSLTDGRVLVLKAMEKIGRVAVFGSDFGDLDLIANEAMTLVASRDLRQWLLVSVLRRGRQ